MSRVRTFVIGRRGDCDLVVDGNGVADRHAEVTITADGRYHVTDRGSGAGTFVYRASQWCAIRQDFLNPDERLRLGRHELEPDALAALADFSANAAHAQAAARQPSAPPAAPDPSVRLVRDPLTGEIVEQPSR